MATCVGARGEQRRRRIWRRRRRPDLEGSGAAAVLQAVGARFREGGGRGEVREAGGRLGWSRGRPERRGRRRLDAARVRSLGSSQERNQGEEGEELGVLRGCGTDGDATPSLSARGEASRARQQGCCLPACFTSMDYWHEEDMKNP